ncbi:MAG TPA: hypothetical protein PLY93_11745 [Turneriella sp.]|nr:hypothetical protein [Turneriella sp.]
MMRSFTKYVLLLAIISFGYCGKKNQEIEKSKANKLGESLGNTMRDLGAGLRDGISNDATAPIKLADELSTVLKLGAVKYNTRTNAITVYCEALTDIDLNVMLKIFDAQNQEMGRVKHRLKMESEDAQNIAFTFDATIDLSNARLIHLDRGKEKPKEKTKGKSL